MIEKRIRKFYNSVQLSEELFPDNGKESKLFRAAAWGILGFAAAVAAAKAIMLLANSVMRRDTDKTEQTE